MSSLLYRLGRWSYRRRNLVLGFWLAVLVAVGGSALTWQQPTQEGFTIPGTESQKALDTLSRTFPQVSGSSAQLVVVAPQGERVDGKPFTKAIGQAATHLSRMTTVVAVSTPFGSRPSGAVSDDGRAALITVQLKDATQDVPAAVSHELLNQRDELRRALPRGTEVEVGGQLFASLKEPGPSPTEAIGLILALIVLLITFGSFAAAGLPLIAAISGVGLTYLGITFATAFWTISSSTPALAVMLGLAVGIDYALFVVARHMDQLRERLSGEESAARAVATAGSAVVFAGITVIIALLGLAVVNIPFLSVMGIAAAVAVGLSVLITITLVPALLGFWNGFLQKAARKRGRKRAAKTPLRKPEESTAKVPKPEIGVDETRVLPFSGRVFRGWVSTATKKPTVTIVAIVVLLVLASTPLLSLRLALPDAGSQAQGTPARATYDLIAKEFGPGYNGPLIVTGPLPHNSNPLTLMGDLRSELQALPGVAAVPLAAPNQAGDTGIIQVVPRGAPDSPETRALVEQIRDRAPHLEKKYGVRLAVTGITAVGIDVSDRLGAALLPFIALIVGLALILLAMVFRSIWVPLTATMGFLLTIGTALGVVTAVFDWGWLAGPLNLAAVGPVISFMPVILIGVLFGLAMDYEVFLVSRIREAYLHGDSARQAIRSGFMSAGKVVTAAALIMFSVFAAFVPAGDTAIKPIALGLAVGVFVDAFIVRMTLMPAVLHALGERAWKIPTWLNSALPSFDIEGQSLPDLENGAEQHNDQTEETVATGSGR